MTSSAQGANERGEERSRPERGRFSSRRKTEAVLRLLRRGTRRFSRELDVTVTTLARWRDRFLAGGQASLESRPSDDRDAEIHRLQAKVGAITIENELLLERARSAEAGLPGKPEVAVMSRATSPSAGRRYGTARICRLWGIPCPEPVRAPGSSAAAFALRVQARTDCSKPRAPGQCGD